MNAWRRDRVVDDDNKAPMIELPVDDAAAVDGGKGEQTNILLAAEPATKNAMRANVASHHRATLPKCGITESSPELGRSR